MFIAKSTTADEILIPAQSNGVNLKSLIVTGSDNTLILKDAISGNVIFKQPVINGDSRGFITNFPVVSSLGSIIIALASASLVEIYYDY